MEYDVALNGCNALKLGTERIPVARIEGTPIGNGVRIILHHQFDFGFLRLWQHEPIQVRMHI